jgi:hypothetical protein
MTQDAETLTRALHLQELLAPADVTTPREGAGGVPLAAVPVPGDHPLAREWQTFLSSIDRLIAEGQRGRFALVKEGHPLTVWDTLRDAAQAANFLWGQEPSLVQEIQPFVRPLFRGPRRSCPA